MKKTYVKPESSLMTLNFEESIVASGGDMITANAMIKFTQADNGCRGLYSGQQDAPVSDYVRQYNDFQLYYDELAGIVEKTGNYFIWFNCFKGTSNV